ncbi:hypothetical protein AUR64_07945 [Haloprofundus marisrubri]|uniref:Uncharacterized protein n=1 Tax=Haloprofundus marisrubri TaxID=1514971 RepID=A0A0W1RBH0_9EURY|nr:hypothetical protein [Haloprofundus marisrubri]KTG10592.1 hypothetical protein AUR64_07945 [Haloprofundus marisrubri]
MDSDDGVTDPIASALLEGPQYQRLRARRHSLFKQSIPRKLAWQAAILGALALVLPLAMTLPASTRGLFPGGDPLSSTPKILLLGAYAGVIEVVAAAGLLYVGYRRLRTGDSLSEHEARHLLSIEDVSSMISLVTGAFAVVAVDGFFLLGHGGEPAVGAFLAAGGGNPFAGTTVPVTVVGVAVPAAVLAAVLFSLSRVLERRLPP